MIGKSKESKQALRSFVGIKSREQVESEEAKLQSRVKIVIRQVGVQME